MDERCEICAGVVRDRVLAPGCVLSQCDQCGHLTRDLDRAPARHRQLAYGGEPTLDRARLELTYRELCRVSPRPSSVFEVGFGAGSMLRRFHDAGARIAGADPDQLGVDVDPVVRAHGRLFDGPVEQVDPGGVDADLVYGIHVLEHVENPVATLRISAQLLRPGGLIQFFTPAGDSDGLRWYGPAWWMLEDPTHIRFFTAASAARAAREAGFTDVRVCRPVADSLVTDAASVVRKTRPADRPDGVLGSRAVIAAGLASAPLVLAARLARPALRPTLQLIARKPLS